MPGYSKYNYTHNSLESLIESNQATVAVVGLGYVGLPLTLAIHRLGFKSTIGFDISQTKIDSLNSGKSYLHEVSDQIVQDVISTKCDQFPNCLTEQMDTCKTTNCRIFEGDGAIADGAVTESNSKAVNEKDTLDIHLEQTEVSPSNEDLTRKQMGATTVFGVKCDTSRCYTHFTATSDPKHLSRADVIIICVPTPVTENNQPDLSPVISSCSLISQNLRSGQLVVLESTTYPGTTTDVMLPILLRSGLKEGEEFFLAYSPERENPGVGKTCCPKIPKVVGADDENSKNLAVKFYGKIFETIVPVSSSKTAEAAKLTENIFRLVNIGLINELKTIFTTMGVDIWEVITAAETKPFGFMPFYPGPGVGGHCIPVDPFYLTWKAAEYGLPTKLIDIANEINFSMPIYVVRKLREELDTRFQVGLNGTRVLLVGMAYKKNIDDVRGSPGLAIYRILKDFKSVVDYHDPLISKIQVFQHKNRPISVDEDQGVELQSVQLSMDSLKSYKAVIICAAHKVVDYDLIIKGSQLIVDTRNVLADYKDERGVVIKA